MFIWRNRRNMKKFNIKLLAIKIIILFMISNVVIQFIPSRYLEYTNLLLAKIVIQNKELIHKTTTYPYLSGSCLFFISNYVYVEHLKTAEQTNRIKNGDLVFVATNLLDRFFEQIYPKISKQFILISHHDDDSTNPNHEKYLSRDNSKLLAWYSDNPGFYHSKHMAIPLGFQSNYLRGFKLYHRTLDTAIRLGMGWHIQSEERVKFIRNLKLENLIPWRDRKYTMYVNFYVHKKNNNEPDPGGRRELRNYFKKYKNFNKIYDVTREDYFSYMNSLGNSKFVICPQGFGQDTHRYSETILMGAIPIVQNSTLFSLFIRSTTLILNDLKDLTQHMLDNPELYIKNMNFSRESILMDYWQNEFSSLRANLKDIIS